MNIAENTSTNRDDDADIKFTDETDANISDTW